MLPKDPYILLSYVNMKLRDENITPENLAKREMEDFDEMISKLNSIGYTYNRENNSFLKKQY